MNNTTLFENNLARSKSRVATRSREASYIKKYLPNLIKHLKSIKQENPGIAEEEFNQKIFEEIDSYSRTVYENSYVFAEYMDYICCQYFQKHHDKYEEISERIKNSSTDYSRMSFQTCTNFDEFLEYYVYNLKKELFEITLGDILEPSDFNYRNFDEVLEENMRFASKNFFEKHFELPEISDVLSSDKLSQAEKSKKIKEFSSWYKLPADRQRFLTFANLFLNKSISYLPSDQKDIEDLLKKDLAQSTAALIEQLDSLGHLDSYMCSHVYQMCKMGFPEYASAICKNGMPNTQFTEKMKTNSKTNSYKDIGQFIDKDKLKAVLSKSFLSSRVVPLESSLALNSFWSNRYIKELDLYSEAMFAVHNFGLVPKILADEDINLSEDEINEMLVKMNTLYPSARSFIERKQQEMDRLPDDDRADKHADDTEDIEEKIIRYSYDPYFHQLQRNFGSEYSTYFSSTLPDSKNNLADDANWYIRLVNPICSSYSMKNESIQSLISSIDNSDSNNLFNTGIILDNISANGTFSSLQPNIGIGIDAGLSYPIRVHTRLDVVRDFLKSVNGNAIIPIYEGADDFNDPYTGLPLSAHVVVPVNEKLKAVMKKASKNIQNAQSPRFVSHLCFYDAKHIPEHLKTEVAGPGKKSKKKFIPRYIDLESGVIYTKENGEYLRISSNSLSKDGGSHGIE